MRNKFEAEQKLIKSKMFVLCPISYGITLYWRIRSKNAKVKTCWLTSWNLLKIVCSTPLSNCFVTLCFLFFLWRGEMQNLNRKLVFNQNLENYYTYKKKFQAELIPHRIFYKNGRTYFFVSSLSKLGVEKDLFQNNPTTQVSYIYEGKT